MIEPDRPVDERERQRALERYEILDSLPERAYDDITTLMARVCDAPISLIGLLDGDRIWLKSRCGLPMEESSRAISFCGHAIVSGEECFAVEDARTDPRFADNPIVTEVGIASYAGAPLIDADGYALGTLCVLDVRPRTLDAGQREALVDMARHVVYLIERHLRERRSAALAERNEDLAHFSGAVSHDLVGPLTNITSFLELLAEEADDEGLRADLQRLHRSSFSVREYVEGLTRHYTSDALVARPAERFAIAELFGALDAMAVRDPDRTLVSFDDSDVEVRTHRAALQQVLLNLLSNAIKHGTGPTRIRVGFEEVDAGYRFTVADDGPGIPADRHEHIFELFGTGEGTDGDGHAGTGVGLATVKRLLDRLGGTISLDSARGRGSTFAVTLPGPRALPRAEPRAEAA